MSVRIVAVDHPELPPYTISDRFRHEVAYFALPKADDRIPAALGEHEYWIRTEDAQSIYDDGVVRLVSPLDSGSTAELELTEEQERWLEWLLENAVQHIRIDS